MSKVGKDLIAAIKEAKKKGLITLKTSLDRAAIARFYRRNLMSQHSCQSSHYHNKLQYEIDSWDLDQALKAKENIIVIDARSADAYQKEHIPGAIGFPHRTMTQESTQERLNKNTLYVTYCDGIGCNASTKGALKLSELGYKIKELIGGNVMVILSLQKIFRMHNVKQSVDVMANKY